MKDLLKKYFDFLIFYQGYSENTAKSYFYDMEKFQNYLLENQKQWQDLEENDILYFLAHSKDSPRTKARFLSALKSFTTFLDQKKIDWEKIPAVKIKQKIPEYLTVEEIKQFFSVFDAQDKESIRDKAMAECLYSCGLRISEMISLSMQNMDLKENYFLITGKGNKERFVPIGNVLKNYLIEYLEKSRPFFPLKEKDFLFITRLGKPFTRVGAWKIIKKYASLSGLPKNIKPHMFRHSFATHLLSYGADLRIIQELLGHSSLTTTEIYTHIENKELKEVIDTYHPLSLKD